MIAWQQLRVARLAMEQRDGGEGVKADRTSVPIFTASRAPRAGRHLVALLLLRRSRCARALVPVFHDSWVCNRVCDEVLTSDVIGRQDARTLLYNIRSSVERGVTGVVCVRVRHVTRLFQLRSSGRSRDSCHAGEAFRRFTTSTPRGFDTVVRQPCRHQVSGLPAAQK